MRIIVMAVLLAALVVVVFHIGGRYEVYCIKNSLQKSGTAIAQWGDTAKVKITGTAEEF